MMEGYGGPFRSDAPDYSGSDPILDADIRLEAESRRRRDVVRAALRRNDCVALAERRRRHVLDGLSFGNGCRCCYDPGSDGGEYAALAKARERLATANQSTEEEEGEGGGGASGGGEKAISAEPAAGGGAAPDRDESSDDDSEFDYLLDEDPPGEEGAALRELEEERRLELETAAARRESALQHGFGAHRQMHSRRILRAAGLGATRRGSAAAVAPAVVLHLYDPESDLSASLDLFLESERMAGAYRGTKFLRGSGRAALLMDMDLAERVLPRVRPDADIPALVAVRDGEVVAYCPGLVGLHGRSDGAVEPRAVEEWLNRAGVLLRDPPAFEDLCRIRPEENALHEIMMREKAAAEKLQLPEPEEYYNCGVKGCNKSFWHEHVGVKNEEQGGLLVSEEEATGNR